MEDRDKTKNQLISELDELRQRNADLEVKETERRQAEEALQERMRLEHIYQNIAQTTLSTLDRDEILNRLSEYTIAAGVFRSMSISLPDYEANSVTVAMELVCTADGTVERNSGNVGITRALDSKDILAETVRTGELQVAVEWDERFDEQVPPERFKGQVAYFIPVKNEDTVVAVLATGSTVEEKEQMLKRIDTLPPFLDQLAIGPGERLVVCPGRA